MLFGKFQNVTCPVNAYYYCTVRLTEFWERCLDQANPWLVARLCVNLKKGSEKSKGPTLKKSTPAHLKFPIPSTRGKKIIVSDLAENADLGQFLCGNLIFGVN